MEIKSVEMETNTFVYCIICAEAIVKLETSNEEDDTEEPKPNIILEYFFRLYRIKLQRKKVSWNCEVEQLPFCGGCKTEIKLLLGLRRKIEELEEEIRGGTQTLKDKLVSSESAFQSLEIYKNDKRYKRVRTHIHKGTPKSAMKFKSETDIKTKTHWTSSRTLRSTEENHLDKIPLPSRSLSSDTSLTQNTSHSEVHITKCEDDNAKFPLHEGEDESFLPYISSPLVSNSVESDSSCNGNRKRKTKRKQKKENASAKQKRQSANAAVKKRVKKSTAKIASLSKSTKASIKSEESQVEVEACKSRRKKTKYEDFVPDSDIEDEDDEDDSYDKRDFEKIRKRKCKIDRETGACTYLNVTLDKLDDTQYKCNQCSAVVSKEGVRDHVISSHTNQTTCKECGKQFGSYQHMNQHVKFVHQGFRSRRVHECPVCGKPCTRKMLYESHRWTHFSEEERAAAIARGDKLPPSCTSHHQCAECGRSLKSMTALKYHMSAFHPTDTEGNAKSKEKELCPECGKSVTALRHHMKRVHLLSAMRFVCSVCDKRFADSPSLILHKQCHTKPIKCSMCPRTFALQRQLNLHLNTHLNIRPFKCDHCPGIAFGSKALLQRHNRVYHEEGSNPKRKCFIRGPETKAKAVEQKDNSKVMDTLP